MRHDGIRNKLAKLLSEVCIDVRQEPPLQPLENETFFLQSTNNSENAGLDISGRNFWSPNWQRAFFDVRVFYPNARSHIHRSLEALFTSQESEKKLAYNNRVIEVEQGVFTPLIISSTGGVGKECDMFLRRLAELLSDKHLCHYSKTISLIRCKLSLLLRKAFGILRIMTSMISD